MCNSSRFDLQSEFNKVFEFLGKSRAMKSNNLNRSLFRASNHQINIQPFRNNNYPIHFLCFDLTESQRESDKFYSL